MTEDFSTGSASVRLDHVFSPNDRQVTNLSGREFKKSPRPIKTERGSDGNIRAGIPGGAAVGVKTVIYGVLIAF